MLNYFRFMATIMAMALVFPMVVLFFRLFFYEIPFSARQIAIQGGAQIVLCTAVYLIVIVIGRLWLRPNV